ncbi:LysR family transcriptional regulator [Frigidibacter sp. ROC022]|uniref:LysR family transcriptional regulator n=1 Tax=Frigidibacter sp. ROC022 TaxID=2971796 RepID=UPI00215A3FB1|nr:LysR family transcriptional regulator [Frigidibacter sp. ROC022]MCR8725242.1 LysR family transcriptional regulator [Frigidibacter sp. ROC022]
MSAQWDDLRIFLSVARAESLSGAGRALKLDPATVGRRVQRLEEELAQPLFTKSPQGYELTEAGARLLPHAEAAEAAAKAAADEMRGKGGGLSGTIRIGAPDGCANFLLPQVCAAIMDAHPGLDIQVVALPRVANLSKREADMAIAVSPPASGRLTVQKITDYHLHLAASRRYLRQNPKITSIADLQSHRIVGYIQDMIADPELDYLAEIGNPRVSFASNSVMVQFNYLVRALGVGVVHDFAMRFGPGLRRVLPDQVALSRAFWLIRPEDDRKSDRLNRFAEALVAGMRAEIARAEGDS